MPENRFKPPEEWFKQAKYDLETAEAMFKTKRFMYTVFMCHLTVEKALKGLYAKKFEKDPPKIHNLNYFCDRIEIEISEDLLNFIDKLNSLSVPTRYPDEIERLLKCYKMQDTKNILNKTKEPLVCLKKNL